jgi:pimeloyl-ACP methyl ester carboxylesterase
LTSTTRSGFSLISSVLPSWPACPPLLRPELLRWLLGAGFSYPSLLGGLELFRLFFFNCVYPGIGRRWLEPDSVTEIWYQSFHQMEMAPALVGATRESCRAYIGHFLRHWAHRKDAHDDVLEVYIDNFLKPGNLEGGFAYYKAAHAGRLAVMKGETPTLPPITTPTCVRWAEHDPLFPYSWTDRLKESFADLDLAPFPGVGHFPHRENPDRAAREVEGFFSRHGWR